MAIALLKNPEKSSFLILAKTSASSSNIVGSISCDSYPSIFL